MYASVEAWLSFSSLMAFILSSMTLSTTEAIALESTLFLLLGVVSLSLLGRLDGPVLRRYSLSSCFCSGVSFLYSSCL